MDPDHEATDYYWGDPNNDGARVDLSFQVGQGFVLEIGEGLTVQTSGSVTDEDVTLESVSDDLGANTFLANPFPAALDVQNIRIDGDDVGWGSEGFSIWEGVPTVRGGTEFAYYDPSLDPDQEATDYYWGDPNNEGAMVSYSISCGQGFVIDGYEGLTITLKAPFSLK